MDERLLRALLSVMNVDGNKPFDQKWYAEITPVGDVAKDMGCKQRVQFWLIEDGSEIDTSKLIGMY